MFALIESVKPNEDYDYITKYEPVKRSLYLYSDDYLNSKYTELRNEINKLNEQLEQGKSVQAELEKAQEELKRVNEESTKRNEQIQQNENDIQELTKKNNDLSNQIKQLKENSKNNEQLEQLEQLESKNKKLEQQITELEAKSKTQTHEKLQQDKEQLKKQIADSQNKIKRLSEQIAENKITWTHSDNEQLLYLIPWDNNSCSFDAVLGFLCYAIKYVDNNCKKFDSDPKKLYDGKEVNTDATNYMYSKIIELIRAKSKLNDEQKQNYIDMMTAILNNEVNKGDDSGAKQASINNYINMRNELFAYMNNNPINNGKFTIENILYYLFGKEFELENTDTTSLIDLNTKRYYICKGQFINIHNQDLKSDINIPINKNSPVITIEGGQDDLIGTGQYHFIIRYKDIYVDSMKINDPKANDGKLGIHKLNNGYQYFNLSFLDLNNLSY